LAEVAGMNKTIKTTEATEFLTVGQYTIYRRGDSYIIEHISGEAMETTRQKFADLIDDFYKREF